MADEKRIRSKIREIASSRKNVTFEEIEWVFARLGEFHKTARRDARHGTLFRVADQRFMVSTHSPGSKQVKAYSVDDFLDSMIELGWYED
jgi:hypothetical protein